MIKPLYELSNCTIWLNSTIERVAPTESLSEVIYHLVLFNTRKSGKYTPPDLILLLNGFPLCLGHLAQAFFPQGIHLLPGRLNNLDFLAGFR